MTDLHVHEELPSAVIDSVAVTRCYVVIREREKCQMQSVAERLNR